MYPLWLALRGGLNEHEGSNNEGSMGHGGDGYFKASDKKESTPQLAEKKQEISHPSPKPSPKSPQNAPQKEIKDILIISATVALAKEHLRKIRLELKLNEKILQDFGELISEEKDTEDHIILKNGAQIRAKGRFFQIRGFRPDIVICDDLEDEEIIYSQEQRDKMEYWFLRTLVPTLLPDQKLVYIGTKIHAFSLIAKLEVKPEFTKLFYKALTNGKSIWEELWPTEKLYALQKELGTYAFEAEYQNNPLSLEEQPIKPHYLDVEKPKDYEIVALAIDPAVSEKETADYNGITIFGRSKDGKFGEIYSEQTKFAEGVYALARRVAELCRRYPIQRIILEQVAFQKVLRPILAKVLKESKVYVQITEAEIGAGIDKKPRDKVQRLMSVLALFEQQLVYIQNPELRIQLLTFPFGEHDDLVDSCVYNLIFLKNYQPGGSMFNKLIEKLPGVKKTLALREVRPGVWEAQHDPDPPKIKSNFVNLTK